MEKEAELLKALSRGEHKAFDQLFISYYPKLKMFLKGFLPTEAEAEDLAQDVFVKLWNYRERLSQVENINSYLYRMAKNTLYTYLEHSFSRDLIDDMKDASEVLSAESLEDMLFAKELEELIDRKVEAMPPQRKAVYCMSRKQGLSIEEIAFRMDLSKRTVETHLYKALVDIRKVIFAFLLFFS
ncbi:MAG: RNA polymerase sigma-70 factor [Parabacteroides sp.]|nr:RNA polymerase sigma-70 factor [Parabacteroides sp.]